jgi:hypothetical protein
VTDTGGVDEGLTGVLVGESLIVLTLSTMKRMNLKARSIIGRKVLNKVVIREQYCSYHVTTSHTTTSDRHLILSPKKVSTSEIILFKRHQHLFFIVLPWYQALPIVDDNKTITNTFISHRSSSPSNQFCFYFINLASYTTF